MDGKMGVKSPKKGAKLRLLREKSYVDGYNATPLFSCGCVNFHRMSAQRQLATILYELTACVESLISKFSEKPEKRSIS
jgi:hypothetical protein